MRKITLLVAFLWTLTVASIIVKSYWLMYIENPVLIETGMIYTTVDKWVPRLSIWDHTIIVIASLVAGAVLMDIKDILCSWLASTVLSFVSSTFYMFLFVWFLLGARDYFASLGVAHTMVSWVFFYVMFNVFKMFFPLLLLLTLLIGFVGAFLRSTFSPSA